MHNHRNASPPWTGIISQQPARLGKIGVSTRAADPVGAASRPTPHTHE
jgi:hypothetical protein